MVFVRCAAARKELKYCTVISAIVVVAVSHLPTYSRQSQYTMSSVIYDSLMDIFTATPHTTGLRVKANELRRYRSQ